MSSLYWDKVNIRCWDLNPTRILPCVRIQFLLTEPVIFVIKILSKKMTLENLNSFSQFLCLGSSNKQTNKTKNKQTKKAFSTSQVKWVMLVNYTINFIFNILLFTKHCWTNSYVHNFGIFFINSSCKESNPTKAVKRWQLTAYKHFHHNHIAPHCSTVIVKLFLYLPN